MSYFLEPIEAASLQIDAIARQHKEIAAQHAQKFLHSKLNLCIKLITSLTCVNLEYPTRAENFPKFEDKHELAYFEDSHKQANLHLNELIGLLNNYPKLFSSIESTVNIESYKKYLRSINQGFQSYLDQLGNNNYSERYKAFIKFSAAYQQLQYHLGLLKIQVEKLLHDSSLATPANKKTPLLSKPQHVTPKTNINSLPNDIFTAVIFPYTIGEITVGSIDTERLKDVLQTLKRLARVSKKWYNLSNHNNIWKIVARAHYPQALGEIDLLDTKHYRIKDALRNSLFRDKKIKILCPPKTEFYLSILDFSQLACIAAWRTSLCMSLYGAGVGTFVGSFYGLSSGLNACTCAAWSSNMGHLCTSLGYGLLFGTAPCVGGGLAALAASTCVYCCCVAPILSIKEYRTNLDQYNSHPYIQNNGDITTVIPEKNRDSSPIQQLMPMSEPPLYIPPEPLKAPDCHKVTLIPSGPDSCFIPTFCCVYEARLQR